MNYGEIVSLAFSRAWRYKSLWLLGFLTLGFSTFNITQGRERLVSFEDFVFRHPLMILSVIAFLFILILVFFILRIIAEHNNGTFPPTIGTNKEYMQAVQADSKLEGEKLAKELLNTPEAQKLMEKLKAQYGKDQPAFMKAWMKESLPLRQKLTQKLAQKHMQGVMFYMMLQPENDSHYAGKDVKLGTPDRPIFWYKPAGAEKYRVIYADLSIKELTAVEVTKLPEAKAK